MKEFAFQSMIGREVDFRGREVWKGLHRFTSRKELYHPDPLNEIAGDSKHLSVFYFRPCSYHFLD